MKTQQALNYERIASAICFIRENYREQPGLEQIAEHIHVSSFHFQRLFHEWAGITPKQFLQYLNIGYAKKILKETHATLFDTSSRSRVNPILIIRKGRSFFCFVLILCQNFSLYCIS